MKRARLCGFWALCLSLGCATLGTAVEAPPVRIKDIASVSGSAGQKLLGYGLLVGLEGTGDSTKSIVTAQALANMLEHFDLKVSTTDLTTKNAAAVIVTATLPDVARVGDKVDLTIASMGDATSLYGGILLPTSLLADDGEVYVIALGPISIGGFNVSGGGGQSVQRNHPVAGKAPGAGTVVKSVAPAAEAERIYFTLHDPDYTTALRVSEAINKQLGTAGARAVGAECVEVQIPQERRGDVVAFIAGLECLQVSGDTAARVVVNERTGTIIIGGDVRILPVAVAHGSLTVTITNDWEVSQPGPLTGGTTVVEGASKTGAPKAEEGGATQGKTAEASAAPKGGKPGADATKPTEVAGLPGARTVVTPKTNVNVEEAPSALMSIPPQTRLRDLVDALNALGVKPRDLIAILQALRAANALQAELVLM
jgi:flagellar P-ring protein precursor FlgI